MTVRAPVLKPDYEGICSCPHMDYAKRCTQFGNIILFQWRVMEADGVIAAEQQALVGKKPDSAFWEVMADIEAWRNRNRRHFSWRELRTLSNVSDWGGQDSYDSSMTPTLQYDGCPFDPKQICPGIALAPFPGRPRARIGDGILRSK